jgi:hypothetical protein
VPPSLPTPSRYDASHAIRARGSRSTIASST